MPWRVHCSSARAKNKKRQNEKKKDTIVSKKGKSTGLETYFQDSDNNMLFTMQPSAPSALKLIKK